MLKNSRVLRSSPVFRVVNHRAISKMATSTVFNVQCPNGRRQKVKLPSQMTIFQVIQEVCKKQGLDSNKYALRHQRKTLDSSLPIRYANLPNNAHLELIESADDHIHSVKKCVVALQLESGERLVHEFNSDVTLFTILMHWKSQSESVTFDDTLNGVVCIYTNQQVRGLEELQKTTLSMIGLNGGRGVVRLIQPTLAEPVVDDNSTITGDVLKTTEEPERAVSLKESSSVEDKLSTEEMDVASASTSSMSMASEVNEGDTMQLSETIDKPNKANQSETISSTPKKKSGKIQERMDFQQETKANDLESGSSRSEKEGAGNEDTMDVEMSEGVGVGGKENSSSRKVDSETLADLHPPPVESVPSTSDGRTSRTATKVEAFSGLGRTLSEGPDLKKPRLYSPPSSSSSKTNQESQQLRNTASMQSDVYLPEREAVAFRLGESGSVSPDDVSDEFFEVTVNDLRLMLKDLKNERTGEEPLMTTKMREERQKSKMDQYDRVAIRVYFPDRTVLQGFFSPRETVSAVTSFVAANLEQKNIVFYLYTTPPRTILDKPNLTLFEAKLFPAAIVHFGSHDTQGSYLHSRHVKEMADLTSANERVNKYNRSSSSSSSHEIETDTPTRTLSSAVTNQSQPEDKTVSTPAQQQTNESRENARQNTSGKSVPKWFKLGK